MNQKQFLDLNKNLDEKLSNWDELILDDQWQDGSKSNLELKQRQHVLTHDTTKRRNEGPNKEPQIGEHPEVELPIPQT